MREFKKTHKTILLGTFLVFPLFVFAAPQSIQEVIDIILNILAAVIPLLAAAALVGFVWGGAKFIYAADDATQRKEGRQVMLYGVIALFVIMTVWGLVALLGDTFGIRTSVLPQLKTDRPAGFDDFNIDIQ
tara:strand:- start:51 stop:443 length:393 start_codon:yes stop_codon:yes gene_type:complete